MKKLALGALAGAAIAYVVKPWERWRRRGSGTWSDAGDPYAAGEAGFTPATAAPVEPEAPVATESAAEVDPDGLTSPGTVDDPKLEAQRAREAAERERESRRSDETKFDELRDLEEERDASQVVGEVPPPRED
ncbi:MAG TPA: hypothetical protein VK278_04170 [Gaiellaceae bacterium]|nr:hypothetical protein [Gaiellaceae bacterium]